MLSFQAAYAAPIIMMSQNRMSEKDRQKAERDFATNRKAEREVEDIQADLARIERKIDEIRHRGVWNKNIKKDPIYISP